MRIFSEDHKTGREGALLPARVLTLLVPLCLLLLMVGRAVGYAPVQEYTPPYEVTDKDLSTIYGRYEIYEAVEYRGSITNTADEGQAWVGQELIVTATLFRALGDRIENPTYTVWYYPAQPEGNVTPRWERWSSSHFGYQEQAYGDEVIEVYKPGDAVLNAPWLYLEIIGTNELWTRFNGWYYKARKTDRPVVAVGHEDYCQVMGPCSAGQGNCDSDSECQSGLTCAEDVGASYGWAADVDVCEGPPIQKRELNDQTFNVGKTFTYDFSQVWEGETSFTVVSSDESVVSITDQEKLEAYRATAVSVVQKLVIDEANPGSDVLT